jgi:hypothetical protein
MWLSNFIYWFQSTPEPTLALDKVRATPSGSLPFLVKIPKQIYGIQLDILSEHTKQ